MNTVDFKTVGDHAAELASYARDNSLSDHVGTLQNMAAAGKPKYSTDRFEVAQLRIVAYDLQRYAAEFDTVALKLLAMVGEAPDAEPAADDEPAAAEKRKAEYDRAAKDAPTGASDSKVKQWRAELFALPRYAGERQGAQPTALRTPSWLDKMLGRTP